MYTSMIQVPSESVQSEPLSRASAPVRTADVGGWTDTWFAGQGAVCNIAIPQRVTVEVHAGAGVSDPLLDHLVHAVGDAAGVHLRVSSTVPAGSGLGTSAALCVAAVAALCSLHGRRPERSELASAAHAAEVGSGRQSGVQDHWAAAHGGVSLLTIDYPRCRREPLVVSDDTTAGLGARLHTVCFARAHSSTELHDGVIERVRAGHGLDELDRMRQAAVDAAVALETGDLDAYGRALTVNHECIRRLDPRLVSNEVDEVAEAARRLGGRGWKVNGAGGRGGSMVVLGPDDADADGALVAMLAALDGVVVYTGSVDRDGVVVG
jgi:D-glycero-alpha-D-manno-heptose-7-phosphate kinase